MIMPCPRLCSIFLPQWHRVHNVLGAMTLRNLSSKTPVEGCGERVAVSDDGKIIACWHPEKTIPYECTKPIAEAEFAAPVDKAVLKPATLKQLRRPVPDALVREELASLTYTTKHPWFPRARDKKFKKKPVDREYL